MFEFRLPSKFYGTWWVPNYPDRDVSGVLSIDSLGNSALETIGDIDDILEHAELAGERFIEIPPDREHNVILGIGNNQRISLINCMQTGGLFPGSCFTYRPRYAVIGKHTSAKPCEHRLYTSWDLLDHWANLNPYSASYDKGTGQSSVVCQMHDNIPLFEFKDIKLSLHFFYSFPDNLTFSFFKPVAKLSQSAQIKIESDEERDLEDYFDLIWRLRSFFSLAMMRPIELIWLRSEDKQSQRTYYLFSRNSEAPLVDDAIQHTFLFRLSDILHRAPSCFERWNSFCEMAQPVLRMLNMFTFSKESFVPPKFIMMTTACEALDAVLYNQNQDTLKSRLTRLSHGIPESLKVFKLTTSQIIFVAENRHYLTHFNPKYEKSLVNDLQLYWITHWLRAIIDIHILRHLGFRDNDIDMLIHNASSYSTLIGRVQRITSMGSAPNNWPTA